MESDLLFLYCRKATGVLKIIHERYSKNVAEFNAYMVEFTEAIQHNDQIQPHLSKVPRPPSMSMQLLLLLACILKLNRLIGALELACEPVMQPQLFKPGFMYGELFYLTYTDTPCQWLVKCRAS